jgi:hypothetical protein
MKFSLGCMVRPCLKKKKKSERKNIAKDTKFERKRAELLWPHWVLHPPSTSEYLLSGS